MLHLSRTAVLTAVILLSTAVPINAAARPSLVFDPSSGLVLSQTGAGEPWYPASLTKLMTAYIVFQKLKAGDLTLEGRISLSEKAIWQPPSRLDLAPDADISVDLALQAMLVYSANDMAFALAETAAGTVQAFVDEMNKEAKRLGLTGSHFVNANGLFDRRQVTTARDMALLASAIQTDFPEYSHYFGQHEAKVAGKTLVNRNMFLLKMPGADGMKTGYVCDSGFNLVATATVGRRRLGAVVFGASSGAQRAEKATALLNSAFSQTLPGSLFVLRDITNIPLGTSVPTDLTADLCPTKPVAGIVSSRRLGGWGLSFGSYSTPIKADSALRGLLLDPAGIDLRGETGVIRLPDNGGFAAVIWDLEEELSREACNLYLQRKLPCSVMSPDQFRRIAELTPDLPPKPKPKPLRTSSH